MEFSPFSYFLLKVLVYYFFSVIFCIFKLSLISAYYFVLSDIPNEFLVRIFPVVLYSKHILQTLKINVLRMAQTRKTVFYKHVMNLNFATGHGLVLASC